jgi:hypothetical protein
MSHMMVAMNGCGFATMLVGGLGTLLAWIIHER